MIESPRIVIAMDFDNVSDCLAMATKLDPKLCRLKVGKELFTRCGPAVVDALMKQGFDVFLDLKFHDIPNTTAKAVAAAADLGVWMVNVHASGGVNMMAAAREAIDKSAGRRPLLIGVTVLTSMGQQDIADIGFADSPQEQVIRLASLAKQSGLDGVVCSAQEAPVLSGRMGADFCLVTPGIRPAGSASNDQTRIVTPGRAVADGSHYLVIGRPITQAQDPRLALEQITAEINGSVSQ